MTQSLSRSHSLFYMCDGGALPIPSGQIGYSTAIELDGWRNGTLLEDSCLSLICHQNFTKIRQETTYSPQSKRKFDIWRRGSIGIQFRLDLPWLRHTFIRIVCSAVPGGLLRCRVPQTSQQTNLQHSVLLAR